MENVYDHVHILAKSIQQSVEYKQYKAAKDILIKNEDQKKRIYDFKRRQFMIQSEQFSGKQVEEGRLKELQSSYATLMLDPIIADFMQAELKFTQMISDVYKIINDAVEIDLDFMQQ